MRYTILLAVLGIAILMIPSQAIAQSEEEMKAWMESITPGESHELLSTLEGQWTYKSKMWSRDAEEPTEFTGTTTNTIIMGGRYLQQSTRGEMMGQKFEGMGITGYDNNTGEFVASWIDNFGTGLQKAVGKGTGDGFVLLTEFFNPYSKQEERHRWVTRITDQDHHVFEYYVKAPDTEERLQMIVEYERARSEQS